MRTLPTRRALVLQHAPWEGPGLIGAALAAAGVETSTRTVLDDPVPDLPEPADLAALVVMGGSMGATDDAVHPGLAAERELLAAAVDAGVPVLGVCLGMQLLAVALGATLHPGAGTEIGYRPPLDLVAPHPVLDPLGSAPRVLHWHSDAVDLPSGATLLARTPLTPVQAFAAGSALGLQFHIEVDGPLLSTWLATPVMAEDLRSHSATDVPEDARAVLPTLEPAARTGLATFAAAARERR
ncbi:gamma-glutamyl-gamma-aminobutyrate hydrolase family protein [Actinotalea sp. M2MS4P-6]|uniref:type 1 glutamine amidotransferase n=1 Tax=Actinotalea sp. M2MS4P-6 TaxID=2983762 RepID=UPI0021E3BD01|nr:gamma-glutamyl-gamma-aminobutyrate hydrolase family protein [Actinotalea sp. M2MS4P-6]MCV2396331.1 gamma-glutamyl-gamma-aminobutyrate hydrolase family protein [Actinotalea sp. M2MS4P-6]